MTVRHPIAREGRPLGFRASVFSVRRRRFRLAIGGQGRSLALPFAPQPRRRTHFQPLIPIKSADNEWRKLALARTRAKQSK